MIAMPPDRARRTSLEALHHVGQGDSRAELEQPVQMIRHEHPGHGIDGALIMRPPQLSNRAARRREIGEKGLAAGGYGGNQIGLSGYRTASLPQIVIGHGVEFGAERM